MKNIKRKGVEELRKPHSKWTDNDASGYFQTSLLKPSKTRDLTLSWQNDADHEPAFIGHFP